MRPFPGLIWGPTKGTLQKDISERGEKWQLIGINGKSIGAPYSAMHGKTAFNEKTTGEQDYYFKKFPQQGKQVSLTSSSGKTITFDRSKITFESLGDNVFAASMKQETAWDEPEKKPLTALVNTSGKIIVDFGRYDFFLPYSDGAIAASKDGRYGYVDANSGAEIVKPLYDHTERFNHGYAKVCYNYLSRFNTIEGFINKSGKEFFKDDPVIHMVSALQKLMLLDEKNYLIHPWIGDNLEVSGKYIKRTNSEGEIETIAESSVPIIYHVGGWDDYCCASDSRTYTGIDSTGTKIKTINLKKDEGVSYRSFILDSVLQINKGDNLGLMSMDGKTILHPVFNKIEVAALNYTPGKNEIAFAAAREDKFGFYSSTGVELAAPHFDSYSLVTGPNQKPLLKVDFTTPDGDQRVCVLDLTGRMVIPDIYSNIEALGENSKYQLLQKNDNNGILKNYTTMVLPVEYGDISMIPWGKQTFFMVYKYKKGNMLIDSVGKVIIPYGIGNDFSPEENFPTDGPAFFILYQKKKYAVARSDKGVITPFSYNYIEVTSTETSRGPKRFLMVEKNKKKGILSTDGKVLIPPVNDYTEVVIFYDQPYFLFKKNGLYGLANESGQIILQPTYKMIVLENPEYFDVSDKSYKQFQLGKDLKLTEVKE
jgi:hypothetical protein